MGACLQFYLFISVCRFDQLRIQRQIHGNSEGKRAARGQASNRARLMFEAHLSTIHGAITVKAFSRPIILGKSVCLLYTHNLVMHTTHIRQCLQTVICRSSKVNECGFLFIPCLCACIQSMHCVVFLQRLHRLQGRLQLFAPAAVA